MQVNESWILRSIFPRTDGVAGVIEPSAGLDKKRLKKVEAVNGPGGECNGLVRRLDAAVDCLVSAAFRMIVANDRRRLNIVCDKI